MRKIRDVLRLHADKLSKRRIAVSLNLGRTAVRDYIKRATRVGLSWPLPEDLCDEALERLLFPPPIQGRKRVCCGFHAAGDDVLENRKTGKSGLSRTQIAPRCRVSAVLVREANGGPAPGATSL